ncbi:MAG: asnB [Bacteroidetes bacterium]|jgi:asparagine synthase (glutamine-hydrolysing)|nr:asnB [Bacteroidota bacterium]
MCGIAGIILKQNNSFDLKETVTAMSQAIAHRGPDGEGFIFASESEVVPYNRENISFKRKDLAYIPTQNFQLSTNNFQLAFAHRRLSIIDLSESGYQPMCTPDKKLWITFNGEIYNYIELKKELQTSGHNFVSESDTEVILQAYRAWGFDCVKRFNGMWSFCIYDLNKQICFASRDRLGVKPFYYINRNDVFAFASEQKAFVKSGLLKAKYNQRAVHSYLVNGLLETETNNFFEGVEELSPGHNLIYSLQSKELKTETYYRIGIDQRHESLSDKQLIEEIEKRLYNAVKLRLRSDVEVGACLSGGIDSSAIVGLMYKILERSNYCFTSVFRNETMNEEKFADIVAKNTKAKHVKIEPTFEGFIKELDALVYSQDVPIWDTSTYAQFKVMELAKQNNIKVVIDGQGADELFAGYHHHYVAKWNNLFLQGQNIEMIRDIKASKKTIDGPFVFFAKEKIKQKRNVNTSVLQHFFKDDFLGSNEVYNSATYFDSVNEQLIHDIETTRLKTFLKCEDRCGMWHSVESRTPFSDDVELIDFMFSFNGNRKIKDGISKYLLREAAKNVLPNEIYSRYDKKGFETPMKKWVTELKTQMTDEIKAANFDFLNTTSLDKINLDSSAQLKLFFKLFILSRWQKVFAG